MFELPSHKNTHKMYKCLSSLWQGIFKRKEVRFRKNTSFSTGKLMFYFFISRFEDGTVKKEEKTGFFVNHYSQIKHRTKTSWLKKKKDDAPKDNCYCVLTLSCPKSFNKEVIQAFTGWDDGQGHSTFEDECTNVGIASVPKAQYMNDVSRDIADKWEMKQVAWEIDGYTEIKIRSWSNVFFFLSQMNEGPHIRRNSFYSFSSGYRNTWKSDLQIRDFSSFSSLRPRDHFSNRPCHDPPFHGRTRRRRHEARSRRRAWAGRQSRHRGRRRGRGTRPVRRLRALRGTRRVRPGRSAARRLTRSRAWRWTGTSRLEMTRKRQ